MKEWQDIWNIFVFFEENSIRKNNDKCVHAFKLVMTRIAVFTVEQITKKNKLIIYP